MAPISIPLSNHTQSNTSKHLRRSNRLHTHDDTASPLQSRTQLPTHAHRLVTHLFISLATACCLPVAVHVCVSSISLSQSALFLWLCTVRKCTDKNGAMNSTYFISLLTMSRSIVSLDCMCIYARDKRHRIKYFISPFSSNWHSPKQHSYPHWKRTDKPKPKVIPCGACVTFYSAFFKSECVEFLFNTSTCQLESYSLFFWFILYFFDFLWMKIVFPIFFSSIFCLFFFIFSLFFTNFNERIVFNFQLP